MLEYASSNARIQTLPSWVADWQDENVTLVNPPSHATEESRISRASLSTLSPARGQLRVRGKIIGLVTARSENDFATIEFPSGSLPIIKGDNYDFVGSEVDSLRLLVHKLMLFREWTRLVDGIPPSHLEDDSCDFFHTLVTFDSSSSNAHLYNVWMDILQYPVTSYDLSNGEKVAEMWKSADKESSDHWTAELYQCSVVAAALLSRSAAKGGQISPEVAELLDFTAHISGNMGNRALILVHDDVFNATLPGTAFHPVMVDDSIVLLEGAEHPVVLRPNGDTWIFVGPAFILGIMDGEEWSDEDGDVQHLRDFVLI